ncbi:MULTISPECIES: hypothetical protein [unclassified Microcoleus]|uniref:hypothetical protein n=1 Tax=unclassified Microcoleus TaxID=2642155 RepID=UPI001D8CA6E1|nr:MULTISPECIES: hypothetical protein [unclassified Microcoleus]MCC3432160.1 hypothetical protein [Microcoleus sp. PH2017_04_SCI_O_A]MCC3443102.1 hypothetical protein [Microcoleus sp. PH2017_03_ELD_O_A]MCC3476102.1 hypothetical protein [Microcoleus sp. PH2017_13_LAR_U_A]MCC3506732.1 hypothetical protein [Microcoleus sp. PH2017_19_SFW_U_A]MCC3547123.1 hypothetical protein [Microcoleus sp. PH2017_24_DOB_U_A]MCC3557115.1 hypothetical protein [Microcoleus sp. PH2017_35_SFW_U_B]MCC3569733.1 hypot
MDVEGRKKIKLSAFPLSSFSGNYQFPITNSPLPIPHYQFPITNPRLLLPTVNCQLSTD